MEKKGKRWTLLKLKLKNSWRAFAYTRLPLVVLLCALMLTPIQVTGGNVTDERSDSAL